ncbi:MAG TPA: PepSY domain-containing protein [Steroidobacteraceae bacterium]|nr:PepSY domain-containing protein [Steroidobacteraceae bacterium]
MRTQAILTALAGAVLVCVSAQAANLKQEAQQLDRAKVSVTDAIREAERQGNGRATEATFHSSTHGAGDYVVKVLSSDDRKLMSYRIDAGTGHIVSAGNEPVEKVFTHLKPEQIDSAQTSLAHAIASAEKQAGGHATYAAVEAHGDHLVYDVKLAKDDGSMSRIKVDSSTGHLASAQ